MSKRLRQALLLALPALTLVLAGACRDPYRTVRDELRENRAKWQSQGARDYSYRLQIGCFCPQEITQPVIVEVRDGVATSIVYAEGGASATSEIFQSYDTIDELFATVQGAINDKVDEVTVTYDAGLGYPIRIYIDPRKTAIDEERALTVSDFHPR